VDAAERDAVAGLLEAELKPYHDRYERHRKLPATGLPREEILAQMREVAELERPRWSDGFASGAVYHGDPEHIAFQTEVYALNSQANPLHADLWPSATKYEAEVVAMVAAMLHGGPAADDGGSGPSPAPEACGTVTSGGTESILLAMKSYRDRAGAERGVERPNMVVPVTAHAAFDKASQYFGIEQRKVPLTTELRADVGAARDLIDDQTVVVVGSAVEFPHGLVDPIEELSTLAAERGVGFHTDSCLGGFVLPWAEKLGYPVPPFDFRLPGVTSMSCDTHKYGYAAKGTSTVLYRDPEQRAYQYYRTVDWPGGLYMSPTFAGSRPGALSAQAWAALVSVGEEGYLDATRRILDTAATIRKGIETIPELEVLGDPLWVISFTPADEDGGINIYTVLDAMSHRGWSLNGLQLPPAVHLAVTLRHTQPGVAERFVDDLRSAVADAKANPGAGTMTPVYGMASSIEGQSTVSEMLRTYLDVVFRV
jgi:glutamate/tyrosine decarboxylase-like PLP-dependent enzyme